MVELLSPQRRGVPQRFRRGLFSCSALPQRSPRLCCGKYRQQPEANPNSNPAHDAGFENHCGVENHKDHDELPDGGNRPMTPLIAVQPAPPPNHVRRPSRQKSVVDEQSAAPTHSSDFSGLSFNFAQSRSLAPVVIKVKGADRVSNQRQTANRPYQPRPSLPGLAFSKHQQQTDAHRVTANGDPDGDSCQQFAFIHS